MTFTAYQLNLITQAEALGYGYSIFAGNVRKQGFCSPKQEEALARMTAAGEFRKNNWTGKKYGNFSRRRRSPEHDISDNEAARSGDYF